MNSVSSTDCVGDEVYSHAIESPIWVQYLSDEQDYRVVRDRSAEDETDRDRTPEEIAART
jgi:hypothetical protein